MKEERVSDKEADKRMNDALKRALSMPPSPHKPTKKKKKAATKKR